MHNKIEDHIERVMKLETLVCEEDHFKDVSFGTSSSTLQPPIEDSDKKNQF